jgi:hypothetical protein
VGHGRERGALDPKFCYTSWMVKPTLNRCADLTLARFMLNPCYLPISVLGVGTAQAHSWGH